MDWWLGYSVNNGEAFWSRNTRKKKFLSSQRESNPWPSRYWLDALTPELWETCGEQGHTMYTRLQLYCSPQVSHGSVVRASNLYLEGHRFGSHWGLRKFFFWVFRLENASPLFIYFSNLVVTVSHTVYLGIFYLHPYLNFINYFSKSSNVLPADWQS